MTDEGTIAANRIQMDVAADGPKISFIFNQFTFAAALEQMIGPPVPFCEPIGVRPPVFINPSPVYLEDRPGNSLIK